MINYFKMRPSWTSFLDKLTEPLWLVNSARSTSDATWTACRAPLAVVNSTTPMVVHMYHCLQYICLNNSQCANIFS